MFNYTFNGEHHTDFSLEYMRSLGMNDEQIESVLRQRDFEESQITRLRRKAYEKRSDPLFMEWQFDKTPEAEKAWRDEVIRVKSDFPMGAGDAVD